MIPRRVVRELERQLGREPGNLTVRVTLAAAYRELGRNADAVEQYRLVAGAYLQEGRADEAVSACASALVMAPHDPELQAMLARARTLQRPAAPPAPAGAGPIAARPGAAGARPGGARVGESARAGDAGERAGDTGARTLERARSSEPGPGTSLTDLETPLPPPMALHDSADSLIGMPVGLTTAEETAERVAPGERGPAVPRPLPPPPSSPGARSPSAAPSSSGARSPSAAPSSPAVALPALPPLPRPPAARTGAATSPQRPSRLGHDGDLGRSIDAALDEEERAFDGGVTFDDLDELDVASPVVALTDVRKPGDPLDATAELATRKHPRLSAHDLGLLELDILVADPEPAITAPAAAPVAGRADVSEKRTSPLPPALIVDEPPALPPPPGPAREPALAGIGLDSLDTTLDTPALSAPEIAIVFDEAPPAPVTDVIEAVAPPEGAVAPPEVGHAPALADGANEPEPLSASDLEPVSASDLEPVSASDLAALPEPTGASAPDADGASATTPASASEPVSASEAPPVSVPVPVPASVSDPVSAPESDPFSVPDSDPDPASVSDPVSAPESDPVAVPDPISEAVSASDADPDREPAPSSPLVLSVGRASASPESKDAAAAADPVPPHAPEPVSSIPAVGGSEITSAPGGASEQRHSTADAQVGADALSASALELPLPLPPPPSDFDDDEPTQPPAADADPPERLHAALLRAHATTTGRAPRGEGTHAGPEGARAGDGGTFAGGFTGTLAELAPDGTALEGPLGVFSMLPLEAADELARRAVVKLFDPGEVVVREGDVGDACYVIVRGEVVVTRAGAAGEPPIELARLGEGALFGEFAILADRRRHATVTTLGDAEIYVIPRLLLRELAAIYPDVGPALDRFYRERLLANLLQTSPLFARLAVDERAGLLASFEPMRVESGKAIVRQGERAGGLFLIVLGAVEVVCRTDDRRAVVLATLGEGAYVGEISLLTGDVATASVVACGPVELAALPATAFYRIVSDYPELWAAMRDEAAARRLHTARVLAGRTAVV